MDRLLTRVDQVGVLLTRARVGPQAQDAILRLQLHLDLRTDEGGRQHRHPDAEVRVHAVLELPRRPLHDPLPLPRCLARTHHRRRVFRVDDLLDALLRRRQDHAVDIYAGDVHRLRCDLAGLDDLLRLDDRDLRVPRHGAVEVVRRAAERHVPEPVRAPGLDEGHVPADRALHDVRPSNTRTSRGSDSAATAPPAVCRVGSSPDCTTVPNAAGV